MKKLQIIQFTVTGKENLGLKVNKFIQVNKIEIADISQLNFNADHTSAILVYLANEEQEEINQ